MTSDNRKTSSESIEQHNELMQELVNCALACEACASACLAENDVTMMTRCIELDRDCADICMLGSRFIMRDSEITDHFLKMCEEICRLCGEECNKHDQEHCKICADSCARCAEACRTYQSKIEMKR